MKWLKRLFAREVMPRQMTTGKLLVSILNEEQMPQRWREELGKMIREYHHVADGDSDR